MELFGFRDRDFYRKVFAICLPIMLQQLLNTAMYMADTLMIGALGDVELAGVGAANQAAYLLDVALFGVTSGAGVFISQYFGKRDIAGVRRTLGLSIVLSLGIAGLFLVAAQLFGGALVGFFSSDRLVIARGTEYIRIASFGYLTRAVTYPYGTANKSTGHPKLPMFSGLLGLVVNIILNYFLIFGHGGFPRLGVQGAAIATLIGLVTDMTTLVVLSYTKHTAAAAKLKELTDKVFENFRDFLHVTVPVFADDALWAVGMIVQNYIYGRMGTDTFAAVTIISVVERLSLIALSGLGTATSVITGNMLGAGERDRAGMYGRRFVALSLLVGTLTGLAVSLLGPLVPSLYGNTSESVRSLASVGIFVLGFGMPMSGINFCILIGLLRSGGDTRAAAYIDLAPMWLLALPLSAVAAFVFHASLTWVMIVQIFSGLVRAVLILVRVKQDKWRRTLV